MFSYYLSFLNVKYHLTNSKILKLENYSFFYIKSLAIIGLCSVMSHVIVDLHPITLASCSCRFLLCPLLSPRPICSMLKKNASLQGIPHFKVGVYHIHDMAIWEMYIECSWPHIENLEHRNLKIRKHVTTSLFRYETLLLLFWVKGFDIRRETQSFYAGFFIWPLSRAAPMARKFVSPLRASKAEPPRSASSFNSLNFLQIPPRASGA